MTTHVAEEAQGELQGAIASTVSVTSIIWPIVMTHIFGYSTSRQTVFFPGAPFIVSIGLLLIAISLLW